MQHFFVWNYKILVCYSFICKISLGLCCKCRTGWRVEQFVHSMLYATCLISVRRTSAYQLGLVSMCTLKGFRIRQNVAPTSSCQLLSVVNMRPIERTFSACLRSTESRELAFCYKMILHCGHFDACQTGQGR